jgi:hypothetical protein
MNITPFQPKNKSGRAKDAETAVFMLLYLDLAYHDAISRGQMNGWDDLREASVASLQSDPYAPMVKRSTIKTDN